MFIQLGSTRSLFEKMKLFAREKSDRPRGPDGIQEVDGSIPFSSTNKIKAFSINGHSGQQGLSAFCPLLSREWKLPLKDSAYRRERYSLLNAVMVTARMSRYFI